jgi:RNA polymerase sigma-70 factor (ECF subfamily)
LALLRSLEGDARLADYRPWHAARADLLERSGQHQEAAIALRRALELTESEPERRHMVERLAALGRIG